VGISLQITPFTHLLKNNTTLSNLNSKIDAMSKTGVFYRANWFLMGLEFGELGKRNVSFR
jgi:hypothetical protein